MPRKVRLNGKVRCVQLSSKANIRPLAPKPISILKTIRTCHEYYNLRYINAYRISQHYLSDEYFLDVITSTSSTNASNNIVTTSSTFMDRSEDCIFYLTNGMGDIIYNDSNSSLECRWYLNPMGNESSVHRTWIVLIIENFNTSGTFQVFRGNNTDNHPIYTSNREMLTGMYYYLTSGNDGMCTRRSARNALKGYNKDRYMFNTDLFVKASWPGDSEVTSSGIKSNCHLLLPVQPF